jgi:putative transcriptional regulator
VRKESRAKMKDGREKIEKMFMTLHSIFKTTERIQKGVLLITALITFMLLSILNGISSAGEAFSDQLSAGKLYDYSDALQPSGIFLSKTELAKGDFIVALPHLKDPNFSKTVVLLIDYGWQGATGLIINRPTDVKLSKALPEIDGLSRRKGMIYIGGPVIGDWMLMLIRSRSQPEESRHVFDNVYVSSSPAVLQRIIGNTRKGEQIRVYTGYAGWAPGQLEQELSRGDWLILRADEETIFDKNTADIWPELVRRSSDYWVKVEFDIQFFNESTNQLPFNSSVNFPDPQWKDTNRIYTDNNSSSLFTQTRVRSWQ